MVEAINKERDYVIKYTTLISELTQEVEKLGGNPNKYRDKLNDIS